MSRTRKRRTKEVIYTGLNARRKSGKHTIKEFLKVMKKHKKGCSEYIAGKSCVPCVKFNALMKRKTKKGLKKLDKYLEDCDKCKTKSKKRCTFHDYLEYSGAKLKG